MPPLVLLHGFTQTTASYDPLIGTLADHGIAASTLDLPGHGIGHGPDREVTGDLWEGAEELADRVLGDDVAATVPRVWHGYSMGARLALHVALARPDALAGLILIGATAGIDDAGERAARRAHDDALARHIETVGVPEFLHEWLAADLFATLPRDPDRVARRARNTAGGLASSLRRWGTGTMDPPLWDRLSAITVPTLVLAGALDAKFTALGHRLADTIGPNATFQPVPDAGHAAHLEAPGATADLIAHWLDEQGLTPTAGATAPNA